VPKDTLVIVIVRKERFKGILDLHSGVRTSSEKSKRPNLVFHARSFFSPSTSKISRHSVHNCNTTQPIVFCFVGVGYLFHHGGGIQGESWQCGGKSEDFRSHGGPLVLFDRVDARHCLCEFLLLEDHPFSHRIPLHDDHELLFVVFGIQGIDICWKIENAAPFGVCDVVDGGSRHS